MDLKIKVSGMREPDNIRAVCTLDIDMIGFVFCKRSPRYVSSVPSHAGLMPDYAGDVANNDVFGGKKRIERVGVFSNDIPQDIITAVYNYDLDYVQLNGNEPAVMIDNLRNTIDPDIRKGVKFIKTIKIGTDADDIRRWQDYSSSADMLLFYMKTVEADGCIQAFDPAIISSYDGNLPFMLGGGIRPEDARRVLLVNHPKMIGIDLDRCFETSPAVKDVSLLKEFITEIRTSEL